MKRFILSTPVILAVSIALLFLGAYNSARMQMQRDAEIESRLRSFEMEMARNYIKLEQPKMFAPGYGQIVYLPNDDVYQRKDMDGWMTYVFATNTPTNTPTAMPTAMPTATPTPVATFRQCGSSQGNTIEFPTMTLEQFERTFSDDAILGLILDLAVDPTDENATKLEQAVDAAAMVAK